MYILASYMNQTYPSIPKEPQPFLWTSTYD